MLFLSCVCCAFVRVCLLMPCACWERADLLALVCDVKLFPLVSLGQVWYLIVSIPDLCPLSYFVPERDNYNSTCGYILNVLLNTW